MACNRTAAPDFALTCVTETAGSYRISLTVDSSRRYHIEEQRIYFDRQAGRHQPIVAEGLLTDDEYRTLAHLAADCRFDTLPPSIGFDAATDLSQPDILYHYIYSTAAAERTVTIRYRPDLSHPDPIVRLSRYVDTFIARHR